MPAIAVVEYKRIESFARAWVFTAIRFIVFDSLCDVVCIAGGYPVGGAIGISAQVNIANQYCQHIQD